MASVQTRTPLITPILTALCSINRRLYTLRRLTWIEARFLFSFPAHVPCVAGERVLFHRWCRRHRPVGVIREQQRRVGTGQRAVGSRPQTLRFDSVVMGRRYSGHGQGTGHGLKQPRLIAAIGICTDRALGMPIVVMIHRGHGAWELSGDVAPWRPEHRRFGREGAGPELAVVADGGGLSGVLKSRTGGVSRHRELLALGQNQGINVVTSQCSGCRHGRQIVCLHVHSHTTDTCKSKTRTHTPHTHTHAVNPASQNNNVEKSSSNLAPQRTTVG